MPGMFDIYVVKLTEENIPRIIEVTKPLGWTLDHLQDSLEVNAEDGYDTWLYMQLFKSDNEIATFNDVPDVPHVSVAHTDELDPKFGIFYKFKV